MARERGYRMEGYQATSGIGSATSKHVSSASMGYLEAAARSTGSSNAWNIGSHCVQCIHLIGILHPERHRRRMSWHQPAMSFLRVKDQDASDTSFAANSSVLELSNYPIR